MDVVIRLLFFFRERRKNIEKQGMKKRGKNKNKLEKINESNESNRDRKKISFPIGAK
jgi:hypothetical protein